MAITAAQTNFLTSLYVGYFDRAPDPAGMRFWIDQIENGRPLNTIAADFAASPVAKTLYPFLATGQGTATSFITSVYQNLFNTTPDADGLVFWKGVLENNKVPVADMIEAIITGATGTGKQVLDNKISVAKDFAEKAMSKPNFQFDTAAENAAKAAIADVTAEATTVVAAEAKTDTFMASVISTFKLTTGADMVMGTSWGDIIIGDYDAGANPTLSVQDIIDGGAGIDTIKVWRQSGEVTVDIQNPANIKNVENLEVSSSGPVAVKTNGTIQAVAAKFGDYGSGSFDDFAAASDQKLKQIKLVDVNGHVQIGQNNPTDIEHIWLTGSTPGSISVTAHAGARNLTLTLDGVEASQISDDQATSLTIQSIGQDTSLYRFSGSKVKTVEIDAQTNISTNDLSIDTAETISIKGSGTVSFGRMYAPQLKVVDASANTGGVAFHQSPYVNIKFIGGAGQDHFFASGYTGEAFSTFENFAAGDKIEFVSGANDVTDLGAAIALGASATLQDHLNASVAGNATNAVQWFQHDGNTYVTLDKGAGATFDTNIDMVVKLTGLMDLSNADIAGNILTL